MSFRSLISAAVVVILFWAGTSQAQSTRASERRVAPECPSPEIPTPDSSGLILGAAGAPVELFGDHDAPDFESVFILLAESGFDLFFPFFGTFEDDGRTVVTPHFEHFLPPELLPAGTPIEQTCAAGANPYADALGRLEIVFPAFLLALDHDPSEPLDVTSVRAQRDAFLGRCVASSLDALGAWQVFDEPVNASVVAGLGDPLAEHELENVGRLASVVRERSTEPVLLVEAALPFWLDHDPDLVGLPNDLRSSVLRLFWEGVAVTAPAADWYGFDLYPVPVTCDLGVVGDYAVFARDTAPEARVAAVLQGFGLEDLGNRPGRRPTPDENRFMAYNAVVNGSSILFWWGQSAMELGADPTLWNAILDTASELRALSGVLAGKITDSRVTGEGITATGRRLDGSTWFFVTNRRNVSSNGELLIDPPENCHQWTIHDVHAGRPIMTRRCGGPQTTIPIELPPYGVMVMVIVTC